MCNIELFILFILKNIPTCVASQRYGVHNDACVACCTRASGSGELSTRHTPHVAAGGQRAPQKHVSRSINITHAWKVLAGRGGYCRRCVHHGLRDRRPAVMVTIAETQPALGVPPKGPRPRLACAQHSDTKRSRRWRDRRCRDGAVPQALVEQGCGCGRAESRSRCVPGKDAACRRRRCSRRPGAQATARAAPDQQPGAPE